MGLDMYLKGTRYLTTWHTPDSEIRNQVQALFPELEKNRDTREYGIEVKTVVGYWRKANQIHYWFVHNVQNGVDDCGSYFVGREQLADLRQLCAKVLKVRELATELLPTSSGFFFGDTNYSDYYYQDLKETVRIIDEVMALPDVWDFEYQSSW